VQQVAGLDASFLAVESATQHSHASSLTIVDVGARETSLYDDLLVIVADRQHLLPLLHRRLIDVPLGLDDPYWVRDSNFDLEFHVRHMALPTPGSDDQLAEQVARLIARPLDRSKPLWELYVIDGLSGQRSAVVTKVHLAAIDGMQGIDVLTTLLDTEVLGRSDFEPPSQVYRGETIPSATELIGRTAMQYVSNPFRAVRRSQRALISASGLRRSSLAKAPLVGRLLALPGLPTVHRTIVGARNSSEHFPLLRRRHAPKTPFNAPITAHRRLALASISLTDAKAVALDQNVKVNDVVLALVAGALRTYLQEHDALPIEPLLALAPVYSLTGQNLDPYSHRLLPVVVSLHTDEPDSLSRLRFISEDIAAADGMGEAAPASMLTDLEYFAPSAVSARAARLVTRTLLVNLASAPVNLVIANVPGPSQPLYLAGSPVVSMVPLFPLLDGTGLSISLQSSRERIDVAVVACRELADSRRMADLIVAELELLVPARTRRRTR
jgi:diacylglycerol O-acyltransferase / wax synthase